MSLSNLTVRTYVLTALSLINSSLLFSPVDKVLSILKYINFVVKTNVMSVSRPIGASNQCLSYVVVESFG